jgi:Ion channel
VNREAPKSVRRRFFVALGHAVHLTWPVLSAILAIQVALGLLVGFVEGWSVGDAVYFTFVTGLTIGYGDIVPRQAVGRALTIGRSCRLILPSTTETRGRGPPLRRDLVVDPEMLHDRHHSREQVVDLF